MSVWTSGHRMHTNQGPAAVLGNPGHVCAKVTLPADDCMWWGRYGCFWPKDSPTALLSWCLDASTHLSPCSSPLGLRLAGRTALHFPNSPCLRTGISLNETLIPSRHLLRGSRLAQMTKVPLYPVRFLE